MKSAKNSSIADLLSADIKADIDKKLKHYPADQKQSVVKHALRLAQDANEGWLSEPLMDAVADYLDLPKIAVYEVATFYNMYELKPVGKHKLSVCVNISCNLCGSDKLLERIEKRLGIKPGETTEDGKFTVKAVECIAACVRAPSIQVNDQIYHDNMTPEKIDELIDALDKEGS